MRIPCIEEKQAAFDARIFSFTQRAMGTIDGHLPGERAGHCSDAQLRRLQ